MTGPLALDALRVCEGTLEGSIRWGEAEGDDPLLLHAITLLLAPLSVGGDNVPHPKLRLHSVRLPVSSWSQLAHAEYRLGSVAREIMADGEAHPIYDAYGSLKLGDAYHTVRPTLLRFGACDGCVLSLHLEGSIDATDVPPSFAPTDIAIDGDVVVGAVRVIGDSGARGYPGEDQASELAARLLDGDAYEAPVVEHGCVVLHPCCRDGGD